VPTSRPRRPSHLGKSALVGVGSTPYVKQSGATVLALAAQACAAALQDAGLTAHDVDGIVGFSLWGDSVPAQAVASSLAVPELALSLDLELGGQAPCFAVNHAAMAVASGVADVVLVYRALKGSSGLRIGSQRFRSTSSQYRYPIGFSAYAQYIAMWARRYMIETGANQEDLAAVAIAQSVNGSMNPRAIRAQRITLDDYWASPGVVDPFRRADCTAEVDGACAVVVTSLARARDLRHRPAVIDGAAWATGARAGYDIADIQSWPDYSLNCHSLLAARLWESSSVGCGDIDFAEIYDCFTSVVLMTLEGLGLAGRGEAGAMIRSGRTALDGDLPVNTHGGLLREGYLHGMNTVAEAVLQLQGRGGDRQVARSGSCVVTSGALMDGSALVLVADR
jgi:acetyl-CoA acetyltransferase